MMSLPPLLEILTLLFGQYLNSAPSPGGDPSVPVTSKPAAIEFFAQVETAVAESERFWTAPFVIADLDKKEVTVWGHYTGLHPEELVEFLVINDRSGQDYESLMVSYAKPGDIHEAMLKIGARPGGSVSSREYRFWPRGDRIVADLEWKPTGEENLIRMPIEDLITYKGAPMPRTPWVFTGAPTLPSRIEEDTEVYAPDEYDPNSIASTFNLTHTVFDLPFQGSKTAVYGQFVRSSHAPAPEGHPVLLRLRPATEAEHPPEIDLTLRFRREAPTLQIDQMDNPGDLGDLGAILNRREPNVYYLTVDFGEDLSLETIQARASELFLMEQKLDNVRVEPPPEHHLFYRAFIPDPRYRIREERPSQPVELHLGDSGGNHLTATVMELEEVWGDSRRPTVLETRVSLETPEAWVAYLENEDKRKPALFVYIDADRTHRDLLEWMRPVLHHFPVVFVYTPDN
ncbi:MAG: YdjY domain-containing protein [Kiritimatiellia bacterium]